MIFATGQSVSFMGFAFIRVNSRPIGLFRSRAITRDDGDHGDNHPLPCHPDRPRAERGEASGSGRTPTMIPITHAASGSSLDTADVPIFLCDLCGKSCFQFRRCLALLAIASPHFPASSVSIVPQSLPLDAPSRTPRSRLGKTGGVRDRFRCRCA